MLPKPCTSAFPGQHLEQLLQRQVADVGRDLRQVLVRDLVRGLVYRFHHPVLVAPLVRAQRDQPVADRHQVARAQRGVVADVFEDILLRRVCRCR